MGGIVNVKAWIGALVNPTKTFRKEKKYATLWNGIKDIAIGLLIAAAIAFIGAVLTGVASSLTLPSLLTSLLTGFVILLVYGVLFYLVALLLGSKGSLGMQLGYMSMIIAPLFIIGTILNLIPGVGGVLNMILTIYGLYPLTVLLMETHKFGLGKAIISWLIPAILLALMGLSVNI